MTTIDFILDQEDGIPVVFPQNARIPAGLTSLAFLEAGYDLAAQVRLRIDYRGAEPITGPLSLAFGGDSVKLGEADDLNQAGLREVMNAIPAIRAAGMVDVVETNRNVYDIRFRENGARTAITVASPDMATISRVTQIQTGTDSLPSIQRINLRIGTVAEVANAGFSSVPAGSLTVTTHSTGDANQPQMESISFGDRPPFGGSFSLSVDGGATWSDPVTQPFTAFGVLKALDKLYDGEFVAVSSRDKIYISRRENGAATPIQANGDGLIWLTGKMCEVDFAEVNKILARHLGDGELAHLFIVLETCADFSDASEPVRKVAEIALVGVVQSPSGNALGEI